MITLPLFPAMSQGQVEQVCSLLTRQMKVFLLGPGYDVHTKARLGLALEQRLSTTFCDFRSDQDLYSAGRPNYRFCPLSQALAVPRLLAAPTMAEGSHRSYEHALEGEESLAVHCPDIVHVHWVDETAHLCALAAVKPLVLTVWGTDINRHFLPGADLQLRRRTAQTLRRADLVIVDAKDMANKCEILAEKQLNTSAIADGDRYDEIPSRMRSRSTTPATPN